MFSTTAMFERANTWSVVLANGGSIDLQRGFHTREVVALPLNFSQSCEESEESRSCPLPHEMEYIKPTNPREFMSWAFYRSHRWILLLDMLEEEEEIWVRFVHYICDSWDIVNDVSMITAHEALDWETKSRRIRSVSGLPPLSCAQAKLAVHALYIHHELHEGKDANAHGEL